MLYTLLCVLAYAWFTFTSFHSAGTWPVLAWMIFIMYAVKLGAHAWRALVFVVFIHVVLCAYALWRVVASVVGSHIFHTRRCVRIESVSDSVAFVHSVLGLSMMACDSLHGFYICASHTASVCGVRGTA